jgi:GWxTD domain-containing protein
MKNQKRVCIYFILLLIIESFLFSNTDDWLNFVKPIITKQELKVYKALKTVESKEKFRKYFWKSRDYDKETLKNEYREEYIKKVDYAKEKLGGINSDRGRVYIYLGKPLEIKKYIGHEKIVNCELWIYNIKDNRGGLPPFMKILFYQPRGMGDYRMFYPGIQSAYDLLTPSYNQKIISRYDAYRQVRMDFPELADASLSIIPMEGSPAYGLQNSSSPRIIAEILSIPEKQVNKSYLKMFESESGIVDVDYSLKEIFGKFFIAKNGKAGFEFISYSLVPDRIGFIKRAGDRYHAKIQLTVRLENNKGDVLFEKNDNMNLNVSESQKQKIENNKISFNGFIPIISGNFILKLFFYNNTSKEYIVKTVKIEDNLSLGCIGFKILNNTNGISPYQYNSMKLIVNPSMIFGKTDTLFGIISSETEPNVILMNVDTNSKREIKNIEKRGNYYMFKTSLSNDMDGKYKVIVKTGKSNYEFIFALIPYERKTDCLIFEKEDKNFEIFKYISYLGEEYLNNKEIDKALEYFDNIPTEFRTNRIIQLLAKVYYLKREYKKVIKILSNKKIKKTYNILNLIANSYLRIGALKKAAVYFEEIRKYGDTVAINDKLGAIFYSLGERKKAEIYWSRAKKIKKVKNK